MNIRRSVAKGGSVLLRALLGGLGVVGAFVSMGLAFLITIVSEENSTTKLQWGILCAVISGCSVLCLLLAIRRAKRQR
jgi:threonine/homoserine/homoserine lactone efflux protein